MMSTGQRPRTVRALPRGHTLAELLVGCALGLALLGASAQLFAQQLRAQRLLLLQARVQQDLSAAADLIVRGLRRAGHHRLAADPSSSPYRGLAITPGSVSFSDSRDAVENGQLDLRERAGFRLAGDTLQSLVSGRWQALSDPAVLRIRRFEIELVPQAQTLAWGAAPACVRLSTRRVRVLIQGQAVSDATLVREVQTTVLLRNDDMAPAACPSPAGTQDDVSNGDRS